MEDKSPRQLVEEARAAVEEVSVDEAYRLSKDEAPPISLDIRDDFKVADRDHIVSLLSHRVRSIPLWQSRMMRSFGGRQQSAYIYYVPLFDDAEMTSRWVLCYEAALSLGAQSSFIIVLQLGINTKFINSAP